eukprot:TRINITY_DN3176_c0_g1_i1.p2 TRINITY_DN3176_c0_g1~~TRINITY_DN3176_c0_g1_i1.p2  ORF type:complete len:114 (+),score=38.70 TRINITY_DN3176_c0_g1_i1:81-422(+)
MTSVEAKWDLGSGWSSPVSVVVENAPSSLLLGQYSEDPLVNALKEMKRVSMEAIHAAMGASAVAVAAAHDNDIENDLDEDDGDEKAQHTESKGDKKSETESPVHKSKKKRSNP